MYEVDDKDEVIELENAPQSSVGAPNPMVVAGEHDVLLAYCVQDDSDDWDGTSVRIVGIDTEHERIAVVRFKRCSAHMLGPPNDEAFGGHPLADRGLRPYGAFEIRESSWVRKLERMNTVHPYHDKHRFMRDKKHFVFSFHDTTFECVAEGFTVDVSSGSVRHMIRRALDSAG
jgi:hypothetical protein